jgi:hypothetical protein
LRDRQSTTLVVAWMSPPALEVANLSLGCARGCALGYAPECGRARAADQTVVCTAARPGR